MPAYNIYKNGHCVTVRVVSLPGRVDATDYLVRGVCKAIGAAAELIPILPLSECNNWFRCGQNAALTLFLLSEFEEMGHAKLQGH